MKNYTQFGDVIEVAAAAQPVQSGQVVIVGTLVGVANMPAAAGEPFNAKLSGVFELPKAAGAAWTQGQQLMWDASESAFAPTATPASGDVTGAGIVAWAPAAQSDTVALVRLSGVPGTVRA